MNAVVADVQREVVAMPVQQEITPAQLVAIAIQKDLDIEKLRQLIALEKEWRAEIAKRAFTKALSDFKRDPPDIIKDLINKQFGSDYASLANFVNTSNRELAKYGLNARWKPVKQTPEWIDLECTLEHEGGHSEAVILGGPPDESTNRDGKATKNRLQAIKSTLSYLEGATFQAITGVVARSKALNPDDDGNGAGKKKDEPKRPEGYDEWSDNLRAVVDEGKARLLEVWKGSPMPMRAFMAKHEAGRWDEMKKLAERASKAEAVEA